MQRLVKTTLCTAVNAAELSPGNPVGGWAPNLPLRQRIPSTILSFSTEIGTDPRSLHRGPSQETHRTPGSFPSTRNGEWTNPEILPSLLLVFLGPGTFEEGCNDS